MQLTDKILRERLSCLQSFLEHTHDYFAGFHIHKVLEIALATYFAKEQQEFGLSIGESIALDMVAVEVVLHGEAFAQEMLLALAKRQ